MYLRNSGGKVQLMDVSRHQVGWAGTFKTAGNGVFAITDSAFVSSQSKTVALELRRAGLIAPLP